MAGSAGANLVRPLRRVVTGVDIATVPVGGAHTGKEGAGVTTICKAILSGATPEQIRDRTEGLAPTGSATSPSSWPGIPT